MTAAPPALVLASSSPRRRELLQRTGFTLRVEAPTVDESLRPEEPPADYVRRLAVAKALAVRSAEVGAGGVVIVAADTVVVRGAQILGKPEDAQDARRTLEDLADRWHVVLSGWCVVAPGETARGQVVETRVRFKPLNEHEVTWYLDTGEWRDKAGGYGIQGRGAFLVSAIEGSYSNVVGLPLAEVVDALGACGVRPGLLSDQARRREIIR